jgi:hypothetical protein
MNFGQMILTLLCKVNKVTAYHRHGQKIPQRDLDDLANYQIEFEAALKSKEAFDTYAQQAKECHNLDTKEVK